MRSQDEDEPERLRQRVDGPFGIIGLVCGRQKDRASLPLLIDPVDVSQVEGWGVVAVDREPR